MGEPPGWHGRLHILDVGISIPHPSRNGIEQRPKGGAGIRLEGRGASWKEGREEMVELVVELVEDTWDSWKERDVGGRSRHDVVNFGYLLVRANLGDCLLSYRTPE